MDGSTSTGRWSAPSAGRVTTASPTTRSTRSRSLDLDDALVVPGFVDIHVHGGGGSTMTVGDPDDVLRAARFHRTCGTTTTLASMVTAPVGELVAASRRIAALIDSGAPAADGIGLAGIHLEGPFLSHRRCGAQNPAHMIDPTPAAVEALIEAGGGHLRVVTIAPERPGAIDAVRRFVAAGVVVAVGHTDATQAEAAAAIEAGATLATHLGNAMAPFHHREPGPIGACLDAPGVTCELIVDGHHLHPTMVSVARRAKGSGGVALITDAMSAAGAGDGSYVLGELDVEVVAGAARLRSDGSLAGSTLTMDAAFRNSLAAGWSITDAVAASSTNPAAVLGRSGEIGSIASGAPGRPGGPRRTARRPGRARGRCRGGGRAVSERSERTINTAALALIGAPSRQPALTSHGPMVHQ